VTAFLIEINKLKMLHKWLCFDLCSLTSVCSRIKNVKNTKSNNATRGWLMRFIARKMQRMEKGFLTKCTFQIQIIFRLGFKTHSRKVFHFISKMTKKWIVRKFAF
jgi:hypothetical protein